MHELGNGGVWRNVVLHEAEDSTASGEGPVDGSSREQSPAASRSRPDPRKRRRLDHDDFQNTDEAVVSFPSAELDEKRISDRTSGIA